MSTLDVLKGNVTGEPLLSLWRHYPGDDLDPNSLIDATISDYKNLQPDLVKLSPHGRYSVMDFGCEIRPGSDVYGSDGSSKCTSCVLQSPSDWEDLLKIDPLDGELGKQLKFVEGVSNHIETPKMMTVFSPTMVAMHLSDKQFLDHLDNNQYKETVIDQLEVISDIVIEFGKACIDKGAEGIFAAIPEADRSSVPSDLIDTMMELNAEFMDELNDYAEFVVLHLHGNDLAFEKSLDTFQPTAVNWHDIAAGPSLKEAHQKFDGGLIGGLDPQQVLKGNVDKSLEYAKQQRENIPLILGPGCVLLQGTDDEVLQKIVEQYRE